MEPEILVVGGGIVGLAAARAAAQKGASVLLVDPRPRENGHNASNDESRIFRLAYGLEEEYTRLARRALAGWRSLEAESGLRLLHPKDLVLFGSEPGFAQESYETLRRLGFPAARIPSAELRARFPHLRVDRDAVVDPCAGWLDPTLALAALEDGARRFGADVRRGEEVTRLREEAGSVAVQLSGGLVRARAVVVAAGFHAPQLVPTLSSQIRVTRQVELFFAAPAEFRSDSLPIFAAFEEGFYGFPPAKGAVKIADHRPGPVVSDLADRPPPTKTEEATAREWLFRRVPALSRQPIVRHRICLYDNTADSRFLLGSAPGTRRTIVAAGFSGHGFKFAPAVGEDLSRMALFAAGIDARS